MLYENREEEGLREKEEGFLLWGSEGVSEEEEEEAAIAAVIKLQALWEAWNGALPRGTERTVTGRNEQDGNGRSSFCIIATTRRRR